MAINDRMSGTATEIEPGPASDGRVQPERRGFAARVLSAVEARQGVVSGRVVTVLGVSLSLALIGIGFAYVMAF